MYKFHRDRRRYFDMTYKVTRDHIIPFIEESMSLDKEMTVLEIGCGEAGVLRAFLERGCRCTGIELAQSRIELAQQFLDEDMVAGRVNFLNRDIYLVDPERDLGRKYDLVILKDVIEHIPDQERFMPELRKFLKVGGKVFFAFPPWMMPYGGHQQILQGSIVSKIPYMHLLPGILYPGLLRLMGTSESGINSMKEIRDTGISIERFERITKRSGLKVLSKRNYLFNPIYEHKFGIKAKRQSKLIGSIPVLRNFVTMGVYYLVESVDSAPQ